MPHRPTAGKSLRQNVQRRARNRTARSALKTQLKKFVTAAETGNVDTAKEELRLTIRALDRSAARGLIKKGTAARQKSRLTIRLSRLVAGEGKKASETGK